MRARAWVIALVLTSAWVQARGQTPSFQGLPMDIANGVSADGLVVVGTVTGFPSVLGHQACRWTCDGGLEALGDLPGGSLYSQGLGISADGSVVVGTGRTDSPDKNLYNHVQAARWTSAGSGQDLGDLPNGPPRSEAYDVSADGSVVVGYATSSLTLRAFRWTAQTGMQDLGPANEAKFSCARGVSADGSVVVGYARSPNASGSIEYHEAFLWTAIAGMTLLGDLPGGSFGSEGLAVSADGSAVVGQSPSEIGMQAFRWTESGGMEGLGILEPVGSKSCAFAVSGDGSVVGGYCSHPMHDTVPFIWDATHGMRNLQEVLENDCGLDLAEWSSLIVWGMSDDWDDFRGRGRQPLWTLPGLDCHDPRTCHARLPGARRSRRSPGTREQVIRAAGEFGGRDTSA